MAPILAICMNRLQHTKQGSGNGSMVMLPALTGQGRGFGDCCSCHRVSCIWSRACCNRRPGDHTVGGNYRRLIQTAVSRDDQLLSDWCPYKLVQMNTTFIQGFYSRYQFTKKVLWPYKGNKRTKTDTSLVWRKNNESVSMKNQQTSSRVVENVTNFYSLFWTEKKTQGWKNSILEKIT